MVQIYNSVSVELLQKKSLLIWRWWQIVIIVKANILVDT